MDGKQLISSIDPIDSYSAQPNVYKIPPSANQEYKAGTFDQVNLPTFNRFVEHLQQQYGNDFSELPHCTDTAFVIVQHGFLNTWSIYDALLNKFQIPREHIFVSTKFQTTLVEMDSYLRATFGLNYIPFCRADEKDADACDYGQLADRTYGKLLKVFSEKLLSRQNNKIKKIVICDEGGRFINKFIKLYRNPDMATYARKFSDPEFNICLIEHTNCGIRAEELNHLSAPLISMAQSYAKLECESPLIAKSLFRAIDRQLVELDLINQEEKTFSVIGLGPIGRAVLSHLVESYADHNITIIVYDENPPQYQWLSKKRQQELKKSKKSNWSKVQFDEAPDIKSAVGPAHIVLGCTGKNIFSGLEITDIIGATDKTYLMSCSSGQREYKPLVGFFGILLSDPSDITTYCYQAEDGKKLYLHNAGFPLNFYPERGAGLDDSEADLTRSLKLAALVQALQLFHIMPLLRSHPEASQWLKGFVKLAYQQEILSWFPETALQNITAQEIMDYRSDLSVAMPNFNELHQAFFHSFDDSSLDRSLGSALAQLWSIYDNALSHQESALTYYLPTKAVNHVPENFTATQYLMASQQGKVVIELYNLAETFTDFLEDTDEKLLLLLGESGVGKSLFIWQYTKQLFHRHIYLLQKPQERWIPVVIEMKRYTVKDLPGLVNTYLEDPEKLALTVEQRQVLQTQGWRAGYKLLVVLEGLDEIQQDNNQQEIMRDCVHTCLQNSGWSEDQVKFIVTCRSSYLKDEQQEQRYFGYDSAGTIKASYRRKVLLPFNRSDSQHYVQQYIEKQEKIEGKDAEVTLEAYQAVINENKDLSELISNPFLLRLFVEAFPLLQKKHASFKNVKRYHIYEAFIEHWFHREAQRLPKIIRQQIGMATTDAENLQCAENVFVEYACLLAGEMYRQNTLEVSLKNRLHNHYSVWHHLIQQKMSGDTVENFVAQQLSDEYDADEFIAFEVSKAEYIEQHKIERKTALKASIKAGLIAFKDSCPLQHSGELSSFIHKSIYEFFVAKSIILSAGSKKLLNERARETLSVLSVADNFELRRIHHESEVLNLIKEIWVGHGHEELFSQMRDALFQVIELSKKCAPNGPAAANAVTILNWMGVMLADKQWQEIHIPGAHLPYAVLLRTNCHKANLRDVNLFNAQLIDFDATEADLENVEFGGKLSIDANGKCTAIAHHPTKPWIAVGYDDGSVKQFDTELYRWISRFDISLSEIGKEWPSSQAHDFRKVTKILYSPSGMFLASLHYGGALLNWTVGIDAPVALLASYGLSRFPFSPHSVSCLTYSPDEKQLAYGYYTGGVSVWEIASQKRLNYFGSEHMSPIRAIDFSFDMQFLVAASCNKIYQWVLATEQVVKVYSEDCGRQPCLRYLTDGSIIFSSTNQKACKLFDAEGERKSIENFCIDAELGMHVSSDSKYCMGYNKNEGIKRLTLSTGECVIYPVENFTQVANISLASNDAFILSAIDGSSIYLTKITKIAIPIYMSMSNVTNISFSADDSRVVINTNGAIKQWLFSISQQCGVTIELEESSKSTGITYSTTGKEIIVTESMEDFQSVMLSEVNSFCPVLGELPYSENASNEDRLQYSYTSENHSFPFFAKRLSNFFLLYPKSTNLVYGDDGLVIENCTTAISDYGHQKFKVDLAAILLGKLVSTRRSQDSNNWVEFMPIVCAAFSPQTQQLSLGDFTIIQCDLSEQDESVQSADSMISRKDITSIDAEPSLEGVRCLSYSVPDAKYLASGMADGNICQWESATGTPARPVSTGHTAAVNCVVYSPHKSQQLIASGSDDCTVRQWVAENGTQYGSVIKWHVAPVTCVAYSNGGVLLVSGSSDGCVAVWQSLPNAEGDQHLVWVLPQGSPALNTHGMKLIAATGLSSKQLTMLAFAGSKEAQESEEQLGQLTGSASFWQPTESSQVLAANEVVAGNEFKANHK